MGKDRCNRRAGAAERRDARAVKLDTAPKPTPARKDTKRWCLGKVAREHVLEWRSHDDVHNHTGFGIPRGRDRWRILLCINCGKHLDYCYPWGERRDCTRCGQHYDQKKDG